LSSQLVAQVRDAPPDYQTRRLDGYKTNMDNFAFIIHPIDPKRDVERKYPLLGKMLPVRLINIFSGYWPPVYISHITGITSAATGKEIEGWFIACPYTPQRMMTLDCWGWARTHPWWATQELRSANTYRFP
jgi:hypothetical protein